MIEARTIKHFIHVICYVLCFCYYNIKFGALQSLMEGNPSTEWTLPGKDGMVVTILIYFQRIIMLTAIPMAVAQMGGLLFYNVFPKKQPALDDTSRPSPFLCVRVVTRGDYPELVNQNVERNLATCLSVGLEKFIIQVVTDKEINLPKNPRVHQTIVDKNYRSKTDCKYKARALQYALEDGVNFLNDDDWIVHLDEETLLTKNSVRGILKFTRENKHQMGQGLITYTNEKIVNWLTTIADSYRVTSDLGALRFCLKTFHKPVFWLKGSYVVTKFSAERDVSFDNGMYGSITEDIYFALKASHMGYTFDWIEGEMWEKSTFTIWDCLNQRKRWMQGSFLVVRDPKLPWSCKFWAAFSNVSWYFIPVNFIMYIIGSYYYIPMSTFYKLLTAFIVATNNYLFSFGAFYAFDVKGYGIFRKSICAIAGLYSQRFLLIIDTIASIWCFLSDKTKFYVVDKNILIEQSSV